MDYTYYDELLLKIKTYEERHDERPNKATIGYKLIDWFIDYVQENQKFCNFKIENIFGVDILIEIEGLEVEIDYQIPYAIKVSKESENFITSDEKIIDSKIVEELKELEEKEKIKQEKIEKRKSDDRMNKILEKLLFSRVERMEIMKVSDKLANNMDNSLKDLKSWIKFGEYLKERGENEDEL